MTDDIETTEPVHEFVCEVCDVTVTLTNEQAFEAGWDYPPFIGVFGVISPRTCPEHGMTETLWGAIMLDGVELKDLPERHLKTLARIAAEQPR